MSQNNITTLYAGIDVAKATLRRSRPRSLHQFYAGIDVAKATLLFNRRLLYRILYAGIDVAKATLQLSLGGTSHHIGNDARGHARILKLFTAAEKARPGSKIHVILEATGAGALSAAEGAARPRFAARCPSAGSGPSGTPRAAR